MFYILPTSLLFICFIWTVPPSISSCILIDLLVGRGSRIISSMTYIFSGTHTRRHHALQELTELINDHIFFFFFFFYYYFSAGLSSLS